MYRAELLKKLITRIWKTHLSHNHASEPDQRISTDNNNGMNISKADTTHHIAQLIRLPEPKGAYISTPSRMLEPCCFYFQMGNPLLFGPQTTDAGPEIEKIWVQNN